MGAVFKMRHPTVTGSLRRGGEGVWRNVEVTGQGVRHPAMGAACKMRPSELDAEIFVCNSSFRAANVESMKRRADDPCSDARERGVRRRVGRNRA